MCFFFTFFFFSSFSSSSTHLSLSVSLSFISPCNCSPRFFPTGQGRQQVCARVSRRVRPDRTDRTWMRRRRAQSAWNSSPSSLYSMPLPTNRLRRDINYLSPPGAVTERNKTRDIKRRRSETIKWQQSPTRSCKAGPNSTR